MLETIGEVIVVIAALVGAGLGIYNFFRERDSTKVKLIVVPVSITRTGLTEDGDHFRVNSDAEFATPDQSNEFGFRITNMSKFDVTVSGVGFTDKKDSYHQLILSPTIENGETWPKKLAFREKITVYGDLSKILETMDFSQIDSACAVTYCDHTSHGNSNALEGLMEYANKTT